MARARGLRLNLIIVRIMRRNTITCDRYQLLCWLRRSQIVTIATAAHRQPTATNRHPVPRSCLYCRFYSDCNSGIIDRRRCEIRKPTARFIALPPPPPPPPLLSPPLFLLAWPPPRMAFCDRRLTPCAIDAATTSALVPASRPISRRDVLSFFFLPFFRPLLLPDDRFVTKLFTRKLKSSDGRKCGTRR